MAFAVGACGGDDFGAAASQAQVDSLCDAICDNSVACDDPPPVRSECIDSCQAGISPEMLAAGAIDQLVECVGDLACTDDDQACVDALPEQDYVADVIAACTAYNARCEGEEDCADPDFQTNLRLFSEAYLNAINACYTDAACPTVDGSPLDDCTAAVGDDFS